MCKSSGTKPSRRPLGIKRHSVTSKSCSVSSAERLGRAGQDRDAILPVERDQPQGTCPHGRVAIHHADEAISQITLPQPRPLAARANRSLHRLDARAAYPRLAAHPHPHVHGIVPGGGLAADADRWIPCRPEFFLPVRVLSRLFSRRFFEELAAVHAWGELQYFGKHAELADPRRFPEWLAPLRQISRLVYAKRPFAGPSPVFAYLSGYVHGVAISNSRLIAHDERGVTFRWKNYQVRDRIRHYGLLDNTRRPFELATALTLLHVESPAPQERHRSSIADGHSEASHAFR